jgi:hypothetical protein
MDATLYGKNSSDETIRDRESTQIRSRLAASKHEEKKSYGR